MRISEGVKLLGATTSGNSATTPRQGARADPVRFARGYYAGQVPGDKALVATVERQLSTSFETIVFKKAFDISTSITCSTTGARPGRM